MAISGSATVCESKTACCSGIDPGKGHRQAGGMPEKAGVGAQASGPAHQRLSIGTVAAILFGAFGIAAMTSWIRPASEAEDVVAVGLIAATRPEGEARATLRCAECGIIESTRQVEQVGAAGGMTGDHRNEIPGKSTTSYQIKVRMRDGSIRVFMDANPANWRPGDRMTLIESANGSKD
jgi:hypothetical protein